MGHRATRSLTRRRLLQAASSAIIGPSVATSVLAPTRLFGRGRSRVRPGDALWPSAADWYRLDKQIGGQLIKVRTPRAVCAQAPSDAPCAQIFKRLKNPYYLGDEPGLTQTLGWVDAWTSQPSVYAVAA